MLKRNLSGAIKSGLAMLILSVCAMAQYGGSGGTGGTTTTGGAYTPGKSYGNGAVIGGAVAGAAGAGVVGYLLYRHHHQQIVGCVAPDGKTLTADKSNHVYELTGASVAGGEHVTVAGKRTKRDSGIDALEVTAVKKDMGQCEQHAALTTQP
jgi:hypothetical protein